MSHLHHHARESTSGDAEAIQIVEKFRVLLEHWIEHNAAHGAEFEKWAQRARDADLNEVSRDISAAANGLREIDGHLRDAIAHLKPRSLSETLARGCQPTDESTAKKRDRPGVRSFS